MQYLDLGFSEGKQEKWMLGKENQVEEPKSFLNLKYSEKFSD